MAGSVKERKNVDKRLFERAKKVIPGGVNSPVRSFRSVGGSPVFIKKAKGLYLYGENGRRYIDFCLSWGALIFGHSFQPVVDAIKKQASLGTSYGAVTKAETELAELIIDAVPSIQQVRLTNSGTEAVMSAIRLARAATGRTLVIKFEGAYHGHADYLLVKSGSGGLTFGNPSSRGVPKEFTKTTIVVPYNDIKAFEDAIERFGEKIAAVIMEPVMANCGLILPKRRFLSFVRRITRKRGILLIFDEVITGFRVAYGSIQNFLGIKADLTCLGKIIGGGMPIGAFGGRRDIMKMLSPQGDVYQAGTLSGNPLSVRSGIEVLRQLKKTRPYGYLEAITEKLCKGIVEAAKDAGVNVSLNYVCGMFSIFFAKGVIDTFTKALRQDGRIFKRFYRIVLDNGVYLSPSAFETNFLSVLHTEDMIDRALHIIKKAMKALNNGKCRIYK